MQLSSASIKDLPMARITVHCPTAYAALQPVHCTHNMREPTQPCALADAIPIPGAKNLAQLRELLGALRFTLDDNEVAVIDERLDAVK